MIWNSHFKDVPEGAHAMLGASQHAWINYDTVKIFESYKNRYLATIGTLTHDYARKYIRYGQRAKAGDKTGLFVHLLDNNIPANAIDINQLFDTWKMYVNDAVANRMRPEQVLYYSQNSFGTADAISFSDKKNKLTIYDLKTGVRPVPMVQLYIYAALFCLEYEKAPGDIDIETRIYQSATIYEEHPTAEDILPIMDKIMVFDDLIDHYKEDGRYEL